VTVGDRDLPDPDVPDPDLPDPDLPDPDGPASSPEATPAPSREAPGWRRLASALTARPDRAQAILGVLLFALGFAVVTQAQQTATTGLTGLRQADLVRLLDDVSARRARLEAESADLEARLQRLTSDTGSAEEARRAAEERRDSYAVLAGTVPTVGPGVTVTIRDTEGEVRSALVLDAVQELRDAGAEAIQIGDVRVVASTAFLDVREGLQVDGRLVQSPIRITAIGDPSTLETALRFPGGVEDQVEQLAGADISIVPSETVLVDAVTAPQDPEFAEPDPVEEGEGR
jgi:uncharacterized protein YlxW (UPF0749 family)